MSFDVTILLPLSHPELVSGSLVKSFNLSDEVPKQVWHHKNLYIKP